MSPRQHFVLFPYLAQGHLIPFLALASRLEQRTCSDSDITLVTTPLNASKLSASLPVSSSISIATLPFSSSDHGLPPDTESTDVLPQRLSITFFHATQTLQPAFESLLSGMMTREANTTVCVISDMFLGWTVEVARNFGAFHSVFVACGAYPIAVYFSLWLSLVHCYHEDDDEEFSLPDFPEARPVCRNRLPKNLTESKEGDPWTRINQSQLRLCLRSDGLLINTVEELDQIGLLYFTRKMNRPAWAIGPITTNIPSSGVRGGTRPDGSDHCMEWLNHQHPCSVLYVCFGSMNTLSAAQMMNLAAGLEASRRPFIWVVRPPLEFDGEEDFRSEWLPEGFEDRIINDERVPRGVLVRKWAPQLEILSHKSTGAFLTHCGWNSVVESLTRGVPMIGWPLSAEQYYNSRLMEEELGVSVEVANGNCSMVESGHVARVIDMVMGGGSEKGEQMRRNALRVKMTMEAAVAEEKGVKGSSVRALDDFVSYAAGFAVQPGRAEESMDVSAPLHA